MQGKNVRRKGCDYCIEVGVEVEQSGFGGGGLDSKKQNKRKIKREGKTRVKLRRIDLDLFR